MTASPTSVARVARRLRRRPDDALAPRASVTVIVPCYNYARYLPQAVGSALAQDGVDVDVVVVDDASTDDSLAVARQLAARDPRVSVVAHATNAGPVQTFNDGLAHVTGEFLVRLDADDALTPASLARAVAVARAYPSVGLVYGHPVHFTGDRPPSSARTTVRSWTVWPGLEWLADRCRDGYNVVTSPEVLLRTEVVAQVGGQQPLAHTHDMEMWFRVAAFSDVAHLEGCDQAWHREHDASLSARNVDHVVDLHERAAAFETLFDGVASTVPGADRMRDDARTALSLDAVRRASHALDRGRGAGLVDDFRQFALDTWPAVQEHRAWRALQRRLARGPSWTARHPVAIASAVAHRVREDVAHRRWTRSGVYREDR